MTWLLVSDTSSETSVLVKRSELTSVADACSWSPLTTPSDPQSSSQPVTSWLPRLSLASPSASPLPRAVARLEDSRRDVGNGDGWSPSSQSSDEQDETERDVFGSDSPREEASSALTFIDVFDLFDYNFERFNREVTSPGNKDSDVPEGRWRRDLSCRECAHRGPGPRGRRHRDRVGSEHSESL